jgi:predicted nucleic acid-binding Zn ribbon protein
VKAPEAATTSAGHGDPQKGRQAMAPSGSVRQRRKRSPHDGLHRIEEITGRVLGRLVPPHAIVLGRIQLLWPELLPPAAATRTWPQALSGHHLVVHVTDNQWLHELQYLRAEIVERLRDRFPALELEDLRVRVGTVPPSRVGDPVAPSDPTRTQVVDASAQSVVDEVEDPELRRVIARALRALGPT